MSSSTFAPDSTEDKDDQLIIIVNADGTITVDPETLEKLIANQHHGSNLSVVRVGDGGSTSDNSEDDGDGAHVNLTVEGFYSGNDPEALPPESGGDPSNEVDPFSQMEPEHIARLESVLQSEQAKEILGTELGDNLTSVLDVLEGKDEVPRPVVHNDHSYTTSLPAYQQPHTAVQTQVQSQVQTVPLQHRPLTRGGRSRGRRGLMTRGGSRSNVQPTLVPISSNPTIVPQIGPKVIQASPQKTYVVSPAAPRVLVQSPSPQSITSKPISEQQQVVEQNKKASEIQQATPTTPRVVIRRVLPKPQQQGHQIQLKPKTLHQTLLSVQPVASTVSPKESGNAANVIRTNLQPVIQKKVVATRGGSGRGRGRGGGRGGRRQQASIPTVAGDDVSAALQAMELSPPVASPAPVITSPKAQTHMKLPEASTLPPKKTQTVIIRKIGSKSEIVSTTDKSSKVRQLSEEPDDQFAPPISHQTALKSVKQTTVSKTPEATSPRAKEVIPVTNEEAPLKKKKEKKAVHTPVVIESLGPELFSTPDIIRRVSTDKQVADSSQTQTLMTQMPVESKVQVETVQTPFKLNNCEIEMTPENLLDTIHAEVAAKNDSRLLAEALLLDDLTNDDSVSMPLPVREKPEAKINSQSTSDQFLSQINAAIESHPTEVPGPKIRKLPPIELPTTRSASKKKAAVSNQSVNQEQPISVQTPVVTKTVGKDKKGSGSGAINEKRHSTEGKRAAEKKHSLKEDFVSDFEEEGETDEESWNSEDDPDRLWCICKKPHNNRFMICCDGCEEWFHGKCVGVTKALGQQMEAQGTEWSCPNCRAKKETQKSQEVIKQSATSTSKLPTGQQTISSLECVSCKKPARVGSNYCCDNCIKRHVLSMIPILNKEVEGLTPSSTVIVYEKKSGNILADNSAPTVSNLADWLMEHQTFEVHKPSIYNKSYKKSVTNQQEPQKPLVKKQLVKPHVEVKSPQATIKQQTVQGKSTPVQQTLKLVSVPVKQLQQSQPSQKQQQLPKQSQPPIKLQISTSKQTVTDKTGNLKQTIITQRIGQSGAKEIGFISKPPVAQKVQIIQAQPLPPQAQPTKSKLKEIKKEEEEDAKAKRLFKSNEKVQPEAVKRSSTEGRKQSVEKPLLAKDKEEKRRDSVSNKEEKKREDKKKDRKMSSSESNSKSEDCTPIVGTNSVEPVRANVRRTIQELLTQRVDQDKSISIANDELKELAISIEEELFSFFNKDAGSKYKNKFRSLLFNIKDPKNLTLYKKIVDKSISPDQLVRLSPEELASQELAQWREKEAKHQLEIIKKNELDLIHQAKTVVLKSRKGEEVIESKTVNISEIESALNRTADDYDFENTNISEQKSDDKSNEKKKEKNKEEHSSRRSDKRKNSRDGRRRDRSRSRSRRSRSKSHEHDRRKKDKDRIKERDKEKEREKQADKAEETLKEIEEVISQHITITPHPIESDPLEREQPSSTVEISTPPLEEQKPPVWRGYLNMTEVTKLYTAAYEVSGSCEDLGEELADQLDCVGRIQPDSVWEYVSRMKKAGTKDIVVIRFQSDPEEEKINYLSLYSYLNSRNRMAVIGQASKTVKDFYVLPLASHSPIPQVLLPLDGPGFDDYRTHLLLGIIIRTKKNSKKMLSLGSNTVNNRLERSYTPPLPNSGFADGGTPDGDIPDIGSTTPPLPQFSKSLSQSSGFTPPLPDEDEPYSPGEDDPYSPEDSRTETVLPEPPEIQRRLEEIKRQIEEKTVEVKFITDVVQGSTHSNLDEDTPYSPSSSFTPPHQENNIAFIDTKSINFPPNIQDILATFQPRPVDVKSDPIVKAYTSQGIYYGDDEDREEEKDIRGERNSRDPRQRHESKLRSLSQYSDSDLIRKAAEMECEGKKDSYKSSYYYPQQPAPPPPPPPPPVVATPSSIYASSSHYKYSTSSHPSSSSSDKDRKRKDKFKERRHLTPSSHSQRRKWDSGGHHNRGGMNQSHNRPPRIGGGGRQLKYRGPGYDRGRGGGFRGGNFRNHRGGAPPPRFHKSSSSHNNRDRNVQSEWDEEIRNFEQRKARERKRKVSRSPSPRRRSGSPPRRRSRRTSNSS